MRLDSGDGSGRRTVARIVIVTPAPDFVGDLVATYTVATPTASPTRRRSRLTVLAIPNRAPIAGDDQAEVVSGGSVTVPIALNDEDPDGDPLTYSITLRPRSRRSARARLQNGDARVRRRVRRRRAPPFVEYTIDDGDADRLGDRDDLGAAVRLGPARRA